MEKKSFFKTFIMFMFVTCYITCFVLANRFIQFGGIVATASALIYPFTYFVSILFYERYGKDSTFDMINFTVVSLIFMGLLLALGSTFTPFDKGDGLNALLNVNFRLLFGSMIAFIAGQYINIRLYDYLGNKKGFDFLISGVIAITIDSFLFIILSYFGDMEFINVFKVATGQYVLGVLAILIYAVCFNSLIPSILKANKERDKELKKVKTKSKSTTKTTKNKA